MNGQIVNPGEANMGEQVKQKLEQMKITFEADFEISPIETMNYLRFIDKNSGLKNVSAVKVKLLDQNNVDLDITIKPMRFQRIRRITGYLVGDLNRWNNGKRAEEHDRKKHGMDGFSR